ncbi:organic cation transporter protein-like [Gigantopelta aegis]|uniref:organic cation transporter protein-like n=1 Tax=Gigantopelta aegis TaxID=1735272 RepID=UPI001B889E95|nr:organic cation transporter protein-like [Gigantopelta aegis]
MESVEYVDVDEVWKTLGRFGRYQLVQLFILILAGIPMAFHVLSVVFIGNFLKLPSRMPPGSELVSEVSPTKYRAYWPLIFEMARLQAASLLRAAAEGRALAGKHMDHICNFSPEVDDDHNTSIVLDSCTIQIVNNTSTGTDVAEYACPDGYNYTGDRYTSFVAEWDLVCEKDTLGKLSQTLVMVGMFLGASFLPALGDRFGRKRLHVGANFMFFVVTVSMAFVPNFIGFAVLRVFVGFFHQGYVISQYIMMIELFPAQQKELIGFSGSLLWGLSVTLITPIAYYMQNYSWRSMQLVFGLFSAISIVEYFILDESLRWLVANKRMKEALKIVKKACKMNHKDFDKAWQTIKERSDAMNVFNETELRERTTLLNEPEVTYEVNKPRLFQVSKHGQKEDTKSSEEKMEVSFLDLLKNRTLRPMALIICYTWYINATTYYGLTLLSSRLTGDPYVNFLLGGVLEIPADILMWILLKKIGRKKTCIFFHTGVGLSLLITVLVAALAEKSHTTGIVQTVFSLAGRFFISASFNAIWIYTPELFPTNIRNIGVGMGSSAARIGGMASPFFSSLAQVAIWAPGAILSAACLLVPFLMTCLPETAGRELPQTISEVSEWRKLDLLHKTKGKTTDDIQFKKI